MYIIASDYFLSAKIISMAKYSGQKLEKMFLWQHKKLTTGWFGDV